MYTYSTIYQLKRQYFAAEQPLQEQLVYTGGPFKLPSQLQIMHPYPSSLAQLERMPIRANAIALGLCEAEFMNVEFR